MILGGVVIGLISIFGGNENQTEPVQQPTLMERIQQRNDKIQTQYDEFFNTDYQEDVVDGLGQNWDD